jgi:hypothetical protein
MSTDTDDGLASCADSEDGATERDNGGPRAPRRAISAAMGVVEGESGEVPASTTPPAPSSAAAHTPQLDPALAATLYGAVRRGEDDVFGEALSHIPHPQGPALNSCAFNSVCVRVHAQCVCAHTDCHGLMASAVCVCTHRLSWAHGQRSVCVHTQTVMGSCMASAECDPHSHHAACMPQHTSHATRVHHCEWPGGHVPHCEWPGGHVPHCEWPRASCAHIR